MFNVRLSKIDRRNELLNKFSDYILDQIINNNCNKVIINSVDRYIEIQQCDCCELNTKVKLYIQKLINNNSNFRIVEVIFCNKLNKYNRIKVYQ